MTEGDPIKRIEHVTQQAELNNVLQENEASYSFPKTPIDLLLGDVILSYVKGDTISEVEITLEDFVYIISTPNERLDAALKRVGDELSERIRQEQASF